MKRDIIDSPFLFKQWMSKCGMVFSLDVETTSLKWLELEVIGWSICDGKQACYVNIETKYKKELLNILEYYLSEAKLVIFHNAAYDLMCLKKEGVEV